LHQVTGGISSPRGMCVTIRTSRALLSSPKLPTRSSWRRIPNQLPAPPQQKAFGMKTRQAEPFKTIIMNPLVFYEPGEERKPLVKCTEWTLDTAIPALKSAGLIRDIDASSPVG